MNSQNDERDLILCVDGGATSTKARVWFVDGTLVGQGCAGPSNPFFYPNDYLRNIAEAVEQALSAKAMEEFIGSRRARTVIGLAGISGNFDSEDFSDLNDLFANWRLYSDKELALAGAHSGQEGAVIIVGTGACTYGRCAGKPISWFDGEEITVGDHVYPVSGFASGAWIGLRLLQALLDHPGFNRPKTNLLGTVETFVRQNFSSMEQVAEQRLDPANLGKIAPLLFHASAEDELAKEIRTDGADSIIKNIKRLRTKGCKRISIVGGLAKPWLRVLSNQINVDSPYGDPLEGARFLALNGSTGSRL